MSKNKRSKVYLLSKTKKILNLFKKICQGRWETNGSNHFLTFGEVFDKYKALHLPTVSENTRIKLLWRVERYLSPLFNEPIGNFTPEFIARVLHSISEEGQIQQNTSVGTLMNWLFGIKL